MRAFTAAEIDTARRVRANYLATCEQHAADLEGAAELGCPQSQRDLPRIEQWEQTYWDDVTFELQMRLGLDDDELQELIDIN